MSTDRLVLHVDKRPEMELRSKLFGHPGVIIPFCEGLIAKRHVLAEEYAFYRSYSHYLPRNLIPEVAGICDDVSAKDDTVLLRVTRELPEQRKDSVLLLRDLASGFEKPCVLDIKLGTRTWALGASTDKVARHRKKCGRGTTGQIKFRVRAAIWHAEDPSAYPCEGGINYVTREFGCGCSRGELADFLADFLRHGNMVDVVIKKLSEIKRALVRLRAETDARMFSTSVLVVYDDAHRERIECRILDFAKTYFDIKRRAAMCHETVEDCEDGVVPALGNLIDMLGGIAHRSKVHPQSL